MTAPTDPDAYRLWARGANDEAAARNDHTKACNEVRDVLEALADCNTDYDQKDLIRGLAEIYSPELLRKRYRR